MLFSLAATFVIESLYLPYTFAFLLLIVNIVCNLISMSSEKLYCSLFLSSILFVSEQLSLSDFA